MTKTGMVIVAGEITTNAVIEVEHIVRQTVLEIGYDHSDKGFDGNTCAVLNGLGKQSQDIAQGVDRKSPEEQGAGDQGLMFGYATIETDSFMPAPIIFSHRLVEKQAEVRKNGKLPWLRPDAKSQCTFRYENDKPVGIDAVVLSTQHSARHLPEGPPRGHHGRGHQAGAAGEVAEQEHAVPHQPDRPVRHRRPDGRLRPHGP